MIDTARHFNDHHHWAESRSILSYGLRLGIRTNKLDALDRLSEHFPPLWKPSSDSFVERMFSVKFGSNGIHELFEDLEPGARSRRLRTVLDDLERRMKMYVAEMAPRRVFVHAGVVGWQGSAIVIPGRSFSGKTSLVAALVRAGATYYSDEYAVLDDKGLVHAYPQSLQIRKPGSSRQRKVKAEALGGITGRKPLRIGLVVISPHRAGAIWRVARVSAGQTVLELLAHTVSARRKPEVVVPTLRRAVLQTIALKGMRGDADEAARLILEGCKFGSVVGKT